MLTGSLAFATRRKTARKARRTPPRRRRSGVNVRSRPTISSDSLHDTIVVHAGGGEDRRPEGRLAAARADGSPGRSRRPGIASTRRSGCRRRWHRLRRPGIGPRPGNSPFSPRLGTISRPHRVPRTQAARPRPRPASRRRRRSAAVGKLGNEKPTGVGGQEREPLARADQRIRQHLAGQTPGGRGVHRRQIAAGKHGPDPVGADVAGRPGKPPSAGQLVAIDQALRVRGKSAR